MFKPNLESKGLRVKKKDANSTIEQFNLYFKTWKHILSVFILLGSVIYFFTGVIGQIKTAQETANTALEEIAEIEMPDMTVVLAGTTATLKEHDNRIDTLDKAIAVQTSVMEGMLESLKRIERKIDAQ